MVKQNILIKFPLLMLLIIILSSSCVFQKKEKFFGTTYSKKKFKAYGDYGILYISEQFYNKKNKFGISLKGIRNDSVVMVSKKRILEDKIIVTEVYTDVENIDSLVRTMHFEDGVYTKSTYKEYFNNKQLPNRPNINDPEIQKIFLKKN